MQKTKRLTEIAIAVALAIVCRFIKVWEMPQGGAVSFTMIPIIFIAIKSGTAAGILAGTVYGLLSAIFHGTLFHPLSLFLDYIFAFGVLGIAGLFKNNTKGIILGSIAGTFGRLFFSVLSGALLFGSYAPAGQNPWVYSIIYNATYLGPELVIVIAVLLTLYKKFPKLFYN